MSMHDFYHFIKFVIKSDIDWGKFGISIGHEDNDPHKPTLHQITISPYPSDMSDTIRFDAIINLFGKSQWVVKAGLLYIPPFYKEIFDLYKICIKVNSMKAFL